MFHNIINMRLTTLLPLFRVRYLVLDHIMTMKRYKKRPQNITAYICARLPPPSSLPTREQLAVPSGAVPSILVDTNFDGWWGSVQMLDKIIYRSGVMEQFEIKFEMEQLK